MSALELYAQKEQASGAVVAGAMLLPVRSGGTPSSAREALG